MTPETNTDSVSTDVAVCSCCLWCKSQYADAISRVFQLCCAKFLKNLERNKKISSNGWWRVVTPEINADSISTDAVVAFDAIHSMLR